MGLLRRSATPRNAVELDSAGSDDTVYVVSPRAAEHAVKAQKETRRAAKADRKLAEKQAKSAGTAGRDGDGEADDDATGTAADPWTGAKVKRYIGIARIVVPIVAPLVYQAVGQARERWDAHRARQLGVAPDELTEFTGRGAALYARIHNLALSARDLRERHAGPTTHGGDATEVAAFVDEADTRLTDLEAAVRAAEQMPASRRRSAHVAVAGELDRIETRLLVHWGVGARPSRPIEARDPS